MLNRFVGRNTVFYIKVCCSDPFKIARSECGLKNERFGGFWGVVQRALKNIDFAKEVKGNLRAGSQAGQSARGGRPAGRVQVA